MKVFSLGDSGNNVFLAGSHVFFSQCSKNKKLSLTELLRLTSDIAVEDFAQRGLTREFLAERNIAILVSRKSGYYAFYVRRKARSISAFALLRD